MIEAVINPKLWGYLVKAVGSVMTEMQLIFNPEGLTISQMSSDKSTMIGAKIPKSEFEQYDCSDERLIILNLDHVTKIAKRLSSASAVGFSFDENGPDSNLFQLVLNADDNKRVFDIPIFAPDEEYKRPNIPYDYVFDSEFQMKAGGFKSIIEDIQILAARGKFIVDSNTLTVRGESDGSGATVTYSVGKELTSLEKNNDELLSGVYSLKLLFDLCEALADKKELIMVKLSHNKPMWIELAVGDNSKLILMLSPILDRRMSDK